MSRGGSPPSYEDPPPYEAPPPYEEPSGPADAGDPQESPQEESRKKCENVLSRGLYKFNTFLIVAAAVILASCLVVLLVIHTLSTSGTVTF